MRRPTTRGWVLRAAERLRYGAHDAPAALARGSDVLTRQRDPSLDIARGLIVALMALDHARIFFTEAGFDPLDLVHTTPGYFLTRWITHLCAPGFFFIAGMSAWLMQRAMPAGTSVPGQVFLRGAWLVVLEIAVFGFAWSFTFGWHWLGVIWGLGAGMMLLAAAMHLPRPVLLAIALAFLVLHDALWPLLRESAGIRDVLLYSPGVLTLPLLGPTLVIYPVLPWAALMLLGHAAGPWLMPDGRPASRRLAAAGSTMLVLFVACRVTGWGEPAGGGPDSGDGVRNAMLSFLNVEKYPPTLQFVLVTLGIMALVLAAAAARRAEAVPAWTRPLQCFGRVPFFFYLLHLFLIHGMALLTALALRWPLDTLFWEGVGPELTPPPGYGFGLPGVYLAWVLVLAMLYPACRWFAGFKRRHSYRWLRYL